MTDLSGFNVPWKDVDYVSQLDLGYYWHSAQKLVSPVVFDVSGNITNIVNNVDLTALTTEQRTAIAGMIFQIFNRKWTKLYSIYTLQYNPVNNYKMSESEMIDHDIQRAETDGGTVNKADTGTISDSGTDTGTVTTVTDKDTTNTGTQSNSGSSNTLDGIFGFNSSESVGSNTSDNTNSNLRTDNLASTDDTTETETRNLADSNTKTLNTNELETRNLTHNITESNDVSRSVLREGNTGIYSPQQLLDDEIELWQWNFYKQVFEDIDSILCLDIY